MKMCLLATVAAAVVFGAPDLRAQTLSPVHPDGVPAEAFAGNADVPHPGVTLVATKSAADAVRGSWGGNMSRANLGSDVYLDEMFIDIAAIGPLAARVTMNTTLMRGTKSIKVVITATYNKGKALADGARWEKVNWQRRVPSSGQNDTIEGNPLVLRADASGKLKGVFEGSDGFSFTLAKKR
jgi:hypothetical protein